MNHIVTKTNTNHKCTCGWKIKPRKGEGDKEINVEVFKHLSKFHSLTDDEVERYLLHLKNLLMESLGALDILIAHEEGKKER